MDPFPLLFQSDQVPTFVNKAKKIVDDCINLSNKLIINQVTEISLELVKILIFAFFVAAYI